MATGKNSSTTQTTQPVEAASMEQFQATPYYQGLGIEALREQLAGYQGDDASLRTQAEHQYRPTYDAEVEALRQQVAQQVQGYDSQRAGTGASYERQRRQTNDAYDESASALNQALTKRGLGRSSLVSTQGAYLEKQRNQALGEIDRDEQQAISAINEKIALLTEQAAQNERTLAGNYARQLENRVNELKQQNQSAAINLQLQIAALQQQGYEAYQEWLLKNREQSLREQEFEKKYASRSTSSGGSNGGNRQSASAAKNAPDEANSGTSAWGNVISSWVSALSNAVKNVANSAKNGTQKTAGTTGSRVNTVGATSAKRYNAVE